ncbi:MAG TPA: glutamine synthetase, partial [Actinopolymorphaceae bacterium]
VSVDPATIRGAGQPPRLPETVPAAIAALRADPVLTEALGAPLFEAFVAVHEGEVRLFEGATPEAVAAATRWRY